MTISESIEALLSSKDRVVEGFYERLLAAHPDLRRHFESIDLRAQASIVTMALLAVEGFYTNRFAATEHYLHVLGHRHYHDGIEPQDLNKFRDIMLLTLQEFHCNDWTTALHDQWRAALDLTITTMLEGYERAYIY